MATESLALKWGTIKRWDVKSTASVVALKKYFDAGTVSMSAIAQHDNDAQRAALIELIEVVDCDEIYLDWDGKYVSKEEAKDYILNYGKVDD